MTTTVLSGSDRTRRLARLREALPGHVDRLGWDAVRLRAHQEQRLRDLLRHARAHSPFHAERLAGVDPDRFALADLPALPVMTKAEMMADLDRVFTDRRLTRGLVEDHLATTTTDARELLGEYVVLASGGSSGQRGVFVYGADAIVDYTLGLTRAGLGRLVAAGAVLPGGVPMSIVAAGSAVHASRALSSLFTGDLLDVTTVPVTLPVPEIVRRLNERPPVLLQAYPSALGVLAAEQESGRLHIAPRMVTGSSELFPVEVRERVAAAFGVPVVDQFGSSEGVLGVSAPDDPLIVLAGDLAVVELVDDDLDPVPPGTTSAKVLVTNLMNPVQPLIRYVLDDRFRLHPAAAEHGHPRVTVEGRADELFRYGELLVHPLTMSGVLVRVPEVVEYQVHQTVDGVAVDVVAPGEVDVRSLTLRLAAALDGSGLQRPVVTVRVVPAIPRDARTGKARRFVPC
jgi:phenylacetate-coenzyme A ligase PaaK-like adenylate-forming protein